MSSFRQQFSIRTILIILTVLFLVVWSVNRVDTSKYHEGFTQTSPFMIKRNADIYDVFYVATYDKIHIPEQQLKPLGDIIDLTRPSKDYANFLDIGSGTGCLVNYLHSRGYTAMGIDQSVAMIDASIQKYPHINVKCNEVNTSSMLFDKGIFTHIMCTHYTVYDFKDKIAFFRNCFYWLKSNGCMIIHLVDRSKFEPISPVAKKRIAFASGKIQNVSGERITDTDVNFGDFTYKVAYDFSQSSTKDIVVVSETFTDGLTHNVRRNEQTLYMENMNHILEMLQYCGFIIIGQVNLTGDGTYEDKNQYYFLVERPN
jgi:SAM-dependent methyltransferase